MQTVSGETMRKLGVDLPFESLVDAVAIAICKRVYDFIDDPAGCMAISA